MKLFFVSKILFLACLGTSSCSKDKSSEPDLKTYNMVRVTGGKFSLGCTSEQSSDCEGDETPVNQITLSDFYIGKYEVTQKEWREIMGNDPSYFLGCDQCPVEQVSWDDVQTFISKLSVKTGKPYRLPTEAEWEYAARGGKKSKGYKYSGGNQLENVAWVSPNSQNKTHPIGLKAANELGLYDMSGNVWEWCRDWHQNEYYSIMPLENPTGPQSGFEKVLRGGSYVNLQQYCRVSERGHTSPDNKLYAFGFRLARSLK